MSDQQSRLGAKNLKKAALFITSTTLNVNFTDILDDKRLDKWVGETDIKPLSCQQEVKMTPLDLEKQKMVTRASKRKKEILCPQNQELSNLPPEVEIQEKKYQEKTKVVLNVTFRLGI